MTEFEKYVQRYLDLIPSENWKEEFLISGDKVVDFYSKLSDEQALFAYDEGKWTLKELLLHLSDTERIFQFRILSFARGEKQALPGFDEELYAANSFANQRTLASLLEEFSLIRKSSQILFSTLDSSVLQNTGLANGNSISADAMFKLIVGHTIHHLNIINERYLPQLPY